jgi:hypothetical protein
MNMQVVVPVCLLLASSVQGLEAEKKGLETAPSVREPALRQELLSMAKEDQQIRVAVLKALGAKGISLGDARPITDPALLKFFLEQAAKMAAVDQKNRGRLKEIVDKHGWPGKYLVGTDGASAAWLLVQHADAALPFQMHCLELMKRAPKDDVAPKDIAYLTDRVLVAQKKKQVYGTQVRRRGGKLTPEPIRDAGSVDKLRAEVGLPPLAEYLRSAEVEYNKLSGNKSDKE